MENHSKKIMKDNLDEVIGDIRRSKFKNKTQEELINIIIKLEDDKKKFEKIGDNLKVENERFKDKIKLLKSKKTGGREKIKLTENQKEFIRKNIVDFKMSLRTMVYKFNEKYPKKQITINQLRAIVKDMDLVKSKPHKEEVKEEPKKEVENMKIYDDVSSQNE